MRETILIAPTTFSVFDPGPKELLQQQGYDLVENNLGRKLSNKELIELGKNCSGVVAGTEKYSQDVIAALPALRVISRLGVGMDNIDIPAANARGIQVCRTQTTPALAVAELALGLMLDLLRKISAQNYSMKNSRWEKTMGFLLSGKTLGIIGLGTIGKHLVQLTKGFGLKYLAYDTHQDAEFSAKHGVVHADFEKVLGASDVVSLHLSLSEQTANIIGARALRSMRRQAILINTARGELVDEPALIKALQEKVIAGAALDVFSQEPYSGPLLGFENVIVTPHIGAYAQEIRTKMELEAVENLLAGLKNVRPK